jgi:tocopherol O-methyltransferase
VIASRTEIRGADIARHYDALDGLYREVWGEQVHHGLWRTGRESLAQARIQLEELVAGETAAAAGHRVCDIGCGYGAVARLLVEKQEAQVTAMTISPAQHAEAVRRNEGRTNPLFLVGDWLENELPSASFDAAIAVESSEHMPDKAAFFGEACRILRPGGRLVVTSWLTREAPSPWQRRWLLEPICRESRMPQIGTAGEYRRLASMAGLAVGRYQEITGQTAKTWQAIVGTFLRHLARHPAALRLLLDRRAHHEVFALTIARVWLAFRTGAMRYGVFTFIKAGT